MFVKLHLFYATARMNRLKDRDGAQDISEFILYTSGLVMVGTRENAIYDFFQESNLIASEFIMSKHTSQASSDCF